MTSVLSGQGPIGVFGGTFDPIHIGHLRFAIEACELLRLGCVRLVPVFQPNHRDPPNVDAVRRLEMLRAALDGIRFIADDREIRRGGTSYTFDTLTSLRAEHPAESLCLLLGADAFYDLCGWHRWDELLDLCHIVVGARPESDREMDPRLAQLVDRVACRDPDILRSETRGRIYFQPIPLLPISSTDIRARIAGGRDISFLVPPLVQQLIEQHKLYGSPV